jgi:hypothetical protein
MSAKSGGMHFRQISFFLQPTKKVRNNTARTVESKGLFFIIEVFEDVCKDYM